jgi:hypothetical protein
MIGRFYKGSYHEFLRETDFLSSSRNALAICFVPSACAKFFEWPTDRMTVLGNLLFWPLYAYVALLGLLAIPIWVLTCLLCLCVVEPLRIVCVAFLMKEPAAK